MLKMMFLVMSIASESDGLSATIKYGPLPAKYCLSQEAKYEAARFLGAFPKDAKVTYECVGAEASK